MVGALLQENMNLLVKRRDRLQHRGGYFWSALAQACCSGRTDDDAKSKPDRATQPVSKEGYVNSTEAIQGSSSPARPPSSEGYQSDIHDIDDDENDERFRLSEDTSLQLLHNFVSYALQGCIKQKDEYTEICARIERVRSVAQIAGAKDVTCWDDGGVARFRLFPTGWVMDRSFLALFEAKKAFSTLREDAKTGNMSPVVSDAVLAQYFAEAVITWRANRQQLDHQFSLTNSCTLPAHLRR